MSNPPRFTAIDSAKGIGIILVVFGHAWRGAFGAGLIPDTALFAAIDGAIYAFHMPLFFFLSGLLFLETLAKYSTTDLLRGRVTRLLWPMALWSWLFFGLKLAGGGAVNSPVSLSDFPVVPLPPYEHLWFLWALFVCQSIAILVWAILPRSISVKAISYATLALMFGLALLSPYLIVPSPVWGAVVAHLPYFLFGVGVGGIELRRRPPGYLSIVFLGLFAGYLFLVATSTPPVASTLTSVLLITFAWSAWLGADRGGDGRVLRVLRYLGRISMVIYLTHTVFSAVLRIVLMRLGLDDLALILVATTGIGLIAPIFVLWGARKLRMVRLLGF